MATKDEIRTWCYKLGDGRLEENEIKVKVETRTEPEALPRFSVGLHSRDGKAAEFDLALEVADACIRQGDCGKWGKRLHAAMDEAFSA